MAGTLGGMPPPEPLLPGIGPSAGDVTAVVGGPWLFAIAREAVTGSRS